MKMRKYFWLLALLPLGLGAVAAGINTVTVEKPREGNFYGAGERGHSLRLNGDTLTVYNRQN